MLEISTFIYKSSLKFRAQTDSLLCDFHCTASPETRVIKMENAVITQSQYFCTND